MPRSEAGSPAERDYATRDGTDAPVAVVTGANSGIGRATAIHLAKHGHVVFGTVRSTSQGDKMRAMADEAGVEVELVELDVADDASVREGFAQILDEAGRVDHLVNNAGVGGNAVAEECPTSLYLDVMNVNLCGAVRCMQAVLPQMRERGSGAIVNITSVTGRIAALAQSPYVTSKWAFEGLSEGLAQELAPFGIRVAIIEPGVTKSAIFAKNIDAPNSTGAYDAPLPPDVPVLRRRHGHATDPFEVGEVIHEAITTDEPRLRYPVSWCGPEMIADDRDRPTTTGSGSARSTTTTSTTAASRSSSAWTSGRSGPARPGESGGRAPMSHRTHRELLLGLLGQLLHAVQRAYHVCPMLAQPAGDDPRLLVGHRVERPAEPTAPGPEPHPLREQVPVRDSEIVKRHVAPASAGSPTAHSSIRPSSQQ